MVTILTDQFWQPLSAPSSWQEAQHDLWLTNDSLGILGGYPVVAAKGYLNQQRERNNIIIVIVIQGQGDLPLILPPSRSHG